jgi:trk system potassium uptake protein TrkA
VPHSKRPPMYVIVAGGGKVGANVSRSLLQMGHEVTIIDQRRSRYDLLQEEFGENVLFGDATELFVLERAGIARPPDLVLAVTGDDEDNLVISQIAREGYDVPKVIARVNDPRNQEHFDLLGITQTVCATSGILGLVEHEVPEHGLVRLLELRREGLELVEVQIDANSPSAGKRLAGLQLPEGAALVSVVRNGRAELAEQTTVLRPGDQVLAVLQPGKEDALRKVLLSSN